MKKMRTMRTTTAMRAPITIGTMMPLPSPTTISGFCNKNENKNAMINVIAWRWPLAIERRSFKLSHFLEWLIVCSDSFGHCLICDWSSREQRAVLPDCVKISRGSRTRTQDTLFSPPPSFLGQHLRGNCPAQFFLRWSPRREWLPQASLRCLRPDCDTGRDRIQPGQKVDISEWKSPEKCF